VAGWPASIGARAGILCGSRGRGSAGRAQPCQGWGRGFESRRPLQELVEVGARSGRRSASDGDRRRGNRSRQLLGKRSVCTVRAPGIIRPWGTGPFPTSPRLLRSKWSCGAPSKRARSSVGRATARAASTRATTRVFGRRADARARADPPPRGRAAPPANHSRFVPLVRPARCCALPWATLPWVLHSSGGRRGELQSERQLSARLPNGRDRRKGARCYTSRLSERPGGYGPGTP
jgi:hypothetical protein